MAPPTVPTAVGIVTASEDGTVRIWEAATGRQIGEALRGHIGKVIAAEYTDGEIRIWKIAPFDAEAFEAAKAAVSLC